MIQIYACADLARHINSIIDANPNPSTEFGNLLDSVCSVKQSLSAKLDKMSRSDHDEIAFWQPRTPSYRFVLHASELTRYTASSNAVAVWHNPSPSGDWVLFSDVQDLLP